MDAPKWIHMLMNQSVPPRFGLGAVSTWGEAVWVRWVKYVYTYYQYVQMVRYVKSSGESGPMTITGILAVYT